MPKEESGRLLSKVAKFVRNPLKDWSELDSTDSTLPDAGYSREMLKEMIERRQRNDFVRRREFDMLRKLRQREAAANAFEATVTPSSFNVSSTSDKSEGRAALTLKKIDEIEEQMSQQWWKGRGPKGERLASMSSAGAETLPLNTDAMFLPPSAGAAPSAAVARLARDSALDEAAIRFAHGDDIGAEAILLQALTSEGSSAASMPTMADAERDDGRWCALFDLYRACGEAEKFAAARMRYAQQMKRIGPDWIAFDALARHLPPARGGGSPAGRAPAADWASPSRLTREGLASLTRALSQAGATWTLDWQALDTIDTDAAGPLRLLFAHWADSPVRLRFMGASQLLAVLAEAAPNNERRTADLWWQLHLAALRMMHLPDDFELVALNYCITYEVSPPAWQDPKGDYLSFLSPGGASASGRVGSGWSSLSIAAGQQAGSEPPEGFAATADSGFAALAGDLRGESPTSWQRLDAELRHHTAPVISCAALVRMDLAAAGALLNWVRARDANGERVQFVEVHCLMAALLRLVGIADHASVEVRRN